jgi:hypothetical protein
MEQIGILSGKISGKKRSGKKRSGKKRSGKKRSGKKRQSNGGRWQEAQLQQYAFLPHMS